MPFPRHGVGSPATQRRRSAPRTSFSVLSEIAADQSAPGKIHEPNPWKGVTMTGQGAQVPTNERILRLVQEIQAELADSKKREQQIARDLKQLLDRK
jgi:hypothetical protein